jgi:hypothetical protein
MPIKGGADRMSTRIQDVAYRIEQGAEAEKSINIGGHGRRR